MLSVFESLPAGFLDSSAQDLYKVLPGPSLFHLRGTQPQPLFVSVLLHGNEDVGLVAIQEVLKKFGEDSLPRSLSFFIGNVEAAAKGLRRLDHQPDYNRVWPQTGHHDESAEHRMMCDVYNEMAKRKPIASIDLHNNTGLNPHYACVNRLDNRFFHLATLFGRTVVYFIRPHGVQSISFAEICPSITVECGRAGDKLGYNHAQELIEALLHITALPTQPIAPHDIDLYHTIATVKIPKQFSFSFDGSDADIQFISEIEHLNFHEIVPGTMIGKIRPGMNLHLEVVDEHGAEVEQQFFEFENNELKFSRSLMPSMFTLNEQVVRQDCLCYLMERYPIAEHQTEIQR